MANNSINETAAEIVELVQNELANKISLTKINRQVAGILASIVNNLKDAAENEDYVVVVNMEEGIPHEIICNNPAMNNALFVCTDNISVADDEDSAVIVEEDTIVVSAGKVNILDDMYLYTKAAKKYERTRR